MPPENPSVAATTGTGRRRRSIVIPALDALRLYRGTALLLFGTTALALGAILPVTSLARRWSLTSRLSMHGAGSTDLGMHWSANVSTPDATTQQGLERLFLLLLVSTLAALALAALTILSISAARASARAVEIAVRRAVGASRRTLFGSAGLEGLAIAVLAVVAGGLLGSAGGLVASRSWPGLVSAREASPAFVVGVALAGIVIVGSLFQLLTTIRKRVTEVPARPLELYIPAIQLGMGLIVLTASTLVARHAGSIVHRTSTGSGQGSVYHFSVADPAPASRSRAYQSLLGRLDADPGLEIASLTSPGLNQGAGMVDAITTDCGLCSEGGVLVKWHTVFAAYQFVSADTFSAVGLPLIAGRGLTSDDNWEAPPVVVVSKGLARRHFQQGEAIGRQIKLTLDGPRWYTVVGIADDRLADGLAGGVQPIATVYLSVLQHPPTSLDLLVRRKDGDSLAAVSSALAASLDHPVSRVERQSERDLAAATAAPLAWFGRWFGVIGWAMLAIASAGTFVLMRLWVVSLRHELGIRRAVGARRLRVIGFILVRVAATGLAGVGIALWFGPALWDTLPEILPDLPPWNLGDIVPLTGLLVTIAILGALVPAWQAAYVHPAGLIGSDE